MSMALIHSSFLRQGLRMWNNRAIDVKIVESLEPLMPKLSKVWSHLHQNCERLRAIDAKIDKGSQTPTQLVGGDMTAS